MSIFISIVSYCDSLLGFTMREAYDKAAWPDDLHFAVIDQSPPDAPSLVPTHIPPRQISYIRIDAKVARGCSWARGVAMSCYRDQDWYLQIDSHTMFEQDWDATLVKKAQACMHFSQNCVLSSYPIGFTWAYGVATPDSSAQRLLATVVKPGTAFDDPSSPVLSFTSRDLSGLGAVVGFHLSGGFIFTSGDFVYKFPWDPFLYFNEEEQSMAMRLYTHGWDIYHVLGVPLFHLYVPPTGAIARPLAWDPQTAGPDAEPPLWVTLSKRARKRMATLFWGDSSELGVHGLGDERSLKDFAEFCGIDYRKRTLDPKAYHGEWDRPAPPPMPPAPRPREISGS